jgi:hypothetical protein
MNMKLTNMNLTGLLASPISAFTSIGAYAGQGHMKQAIKEA